jgi:hypothetical protein
MASITLVRTISFSIYQRSKHSYCNWLKENVGVDVMGHVISKNSLPNFWSLATFGAAGATAGSCITLIACESVPNRCTICPKPSLGQKQWAGYKSQGVPRLTHDDANLYRSHKGPFELTKLSAQVSVLMADKKNCPKPESHAIAASYQNKGTFKTLRNIVKHRGLSGLYTGFNLHLCTFTACL